MLRTLWFALELRLVLKIRKQCVGNLTDFFYHKTNKKALRLCPVLL